MRGADDHALSARRLDPSGRGAPAGKDQRMDMMPVDHRELEIALVWRARNRFPDRGFAHRYRSRQRPATRQGHHSSVCGIRSGPIDLRQNRPLPIGRSSSMNGLHWKPHHLLSDPLLPPGSRRPRCRRQISRRASPARRPDALLELSRCANEGNWRLRSTRAGIVAGQRAENPDSPEAPRPRSRRCVDRG